MFKQLTHLFEDVIEISGVMGETPKVSPPLPGITWKEFWASLKSGELDTLDF